MGCHGRGWWPSFLSFWSITSCGRVFEPRRYSLEKGSLVMQTRLASGPFSLLDLSKVLRRPRRFTRPLAFCNSIIYLGGGCKCNIITLMCAIYDTIHVQVHTCKHPKKSQSSLSHPVHSDRRVLHAIPESTKSRRRLALSFFFLCKRGGAVRFRLTCSFAC